MIPKKILGRTGLNISRIGLGTTEIGFVYGIGPRDVPSPDEAVKFLHYIVERGITFIDTAHFYGHAEEAIGKSGIAKKEGVVVATKAGHILDRAENITSAELENLIRGEIEDSRKKLDLDILPLVLYHGGSAKQIKEGALVDIMGKLKNENKIKFTGISTRGEEAPLAAIESGFFDVIQVAYSILDQRMTPKVLIEAKKKDMGVVNRSVFLKGVLTPAAEYLPKELSPLKEGSLKAKKIAEKVGVDLPELALRFSLSSGAVSTSLVGTNKIEHIESAIKAAESGSLPKDVLEELRRLAISDISQVDPAHWPPGAVSDQKAGKKIFPHFYGNKK